MAVGNVVPTTFQNIKIWIAVFVIQATKILIDVNDLRKNVVTQTVG